jgi:phytoene synthase
MASVPQATMPISQDAPHRGAAPANVAADSIRSALPRGLDPAVRAVLSPLPTDARPQAALRLTAELTRSHYENFSVISVLLPRHLRPHFCNVYAFCRGADDLADELGSTDLARQQLARLRRETLRMFDEPPDVHSPALMHALSATVRQFAIPARPFLDLIDAFEQDQRVTRYESFEQVLDYCRRSADPVGRLVLYMCGYRDSRRQELSDKICSALQLANFWQDVRRDRIDRDRVYIPAQDLAAFGVDIADIDAGRFTAPFARLMQFQVDRTESLFDEGDALLPMLNAQIRPQIELFSRGGRAILAAIRRRNHDTLTSRPTLAKSDKVRLVATAFGSSLKRRFTDRPNPDDSPMAVSRDYCQELTRRNARNFYFGLRLMPHAKRPAMYALYAWMRRADDLADDQRAGRSRARQLADLDTFAARTHAAIAAGAGSAKIADPASGAPVDDDPLWPAFVDMVHRYCVPVRLFDDAIAGQRHDLQNAPIASFDDLYQYCYRVAGVVGLASIHVFGFDGSAAARQQAIDRGVAFQLTNILRDVREDMSLGRCYLPADELAAEHVTPADLPTSPKLEAILRHQIDRAFSYYEKSAGLEDRISRDSRPTLAAMTEIYRRLLERISRSPAIVMQRRVSLPIWQKVAIAWRASRKTP